MNTAQQRLCAAQIDPENEQLLQQHITCAAAELPLLLDEDQAYFGSRVPNIAAFLQSAGAAQHNRHNKTPSVHACGQHNPVS